MENTKQSLKERVTVQVPCVICGEMVNVQILKNIPVESYHVCCASCQQEYGKGEKNENVGK